MVKLIRDKVNENRIGNGTTSHISENELDEYGDEHWDYIIYNNNTLDDLFDAIDKIVNLD